VYSVISKLNGSPDFCTIGFRGIEFVGGEAFSGKVKADLLLVIESFAFTNDLSRQEPGALIHAWRTAIHEATSEQEYVVKT
jgi:hypothetical protein